MKETSKNTRNDFFKTDGGKTKSNAIEVPSISLPKGGGAIKGIDEKFSVNAVNGTSSFSIPLPFSPARGASPQLSLSYSSGAGNGIFGLGWNLSLGSIRRKTDKGLPQYIDVIDSDTFLFSEAEDLVPAFEKKVGGDFKLDANGDYIIHEKDSLDGLFTIRYYIPRIEGLFARIERWYAKNGNEIKWKVTTRDNATTLFGWTANARIANPSDSSQIFEWLPQFVFNDKGNCAHYIYKRENEVGFDDSLLHNRNRLKDGKITYTNLYIDKVLYGNKTPYKQFGDAFPAEIDYLFSTVFDYGTLLPIDIVDKVNIWDFRNDAFSDYKAGFEIRTTRLCKRVLLFHHFKGANEYDGLVRSVNFEYDTNVEEDFTFLKKIYSHGYIKKSDGSYSEKHLPPMEFSYQAHEWNREVKTISSNDLVHAPSGLDEQQYQFTDLYNEGLNGILTEQANGWYYKHNLGNGNFEQAKLVSPKPSFAGLGSVMQLADLDADGGKQLVSFSNQPLGFFELDDEDKWQGFRPFNAMPNIDFGDQNTRMLDLNGDGKPEVVISEDNVFTWYPSEGRLGYSQAQRTIKPYDEEAGPAIVFADQLQTIFLADMSGSGMSDICRIRNGSVCYWPNLGYGKFGTKVAMDHAPIFDSPDAFNPAYLRLTDIDGSGTTDIVYLGKNKFTCWKNLSGNRFGTTPFEIEGFPEIHSQARVTVNDLLGNGVACIVWSSALSKDTNTPLKYIDLMNSKKPHIMVSYKNNMGKEVNMEYTPSTKFYLEDKMAGKPWVTKLHFPIHCISKTTTEDKISGYKFVSEYKYHHGYYDHPEREFRGFGMVEQIDAETFEHWKKVDATNITEVDLHQEPVVSKTWNHTGAFLGKDRILNQFKEDYWYVEMERQGFPVVHHEVELPDARLVTAPGLDAALIDHLSGQEWQEALRACKGMGLRSETFALDAIKLGNTVDARKKELTPFTVATHNCLIELVQPKGKNQYAVFTVKESEAISYSYERNTEDPRIVHSINIKLDEYGNVLESAAIVYPRMIIDPDLPLQTKQGQSKTVIIYSENQFTNDVISDGVYLLRLPSELKTFELKWIDKINTYYNASDFEDILNNARSDTTLYHEIDKALVAGKAQRRLIEHVRSIYYNNNLKDPLPIHQLHSPAFPYESYQLAYTPELLADIFGPINVPGAKLSDALMIEGKFAHIEGDTNWWIRSGTTQFIEGAETASTSQNRFYVPISYTDPYQSVTKVKYYGNYYLFINETEDVLGNKSSVEKFNFRTLSPQKLKDINANLSEAITDELGLVKAVAVMGKGNEADDLTGLIEITEPAESIAIQNFFKAVDSVELVQLGKNLLKHASARFVYDFDKYKLVDDENKIHIKNGEPEKVKKLPPVVVASITREQHFQQLADSPVQIAFEYSNGIGEVVMKKVQAEPGIAKQVVVNADLSITINEVNTSSLLPKQLRWIGNGRTIKNNKGNAVKQYEPYFSVTWLYEDYKELVETGVTPIMYYDAAGRLVKTEMPDGTFSKVEFNSWKQAVYDANDCVLDSDWYKKRTDNNHPNFINDLKEKQAAIKSAKHVNTPQVLHFDTLGRPVLSIDHNKNIQTNADEFYHTKVKLDSEGNLRTVTDARNNIVMQYKYDMLGNVVYQLSMDAGQRWLFINILGNPLRTWDERNHEFQYFYDIAHRPTHSKVIGGDRKKLDGSDDLLDNIFDRVIYGESQLTGIRSNANRFNEAALQARNTIGQVIQHYDTGGLVETLSYDFKGQPLAATRKLFSKYKEVTNWIEPIPIADLENDAFLFSTETDALGRITKQIAPDGSVITPSYNEAGLLDSESVLHPGAVIASTYIENIDYNEKGQREKIKYGNKVIAKYEYDKETFHLKSLESTRQNDLLQDLTYTYDAVGNITAIKDDAFDSEFFSNRVVDPINDYTYDALYRLVEAKGRENNAVMTFGETDNWNDAPFMQPNPMSVRNYTQRYEYDSVGNIQLMEHKATGNDWTRKYEYQDLNNRIKSTNIVGNGDPRNYTDYDHHTQHGFITKMPHLQEMGWNFKEELVKTITQKVNPGNGTPETTYYHYDGSGQRIRKITENFSASNNPTKKDERIYIAGYELYKKHSGTAKGLERVSLSLMDGDHRFVMIETRNEVNDDTERQLVRYQFHNHLGSAALELDDSARVISYEEYHPYGTTAYQAKNTTIRSAAKSYRYTGMERDEETGLEYHSARYYLPWLGRWLSADPIGIEDGVNVYVSCKNNPIVYFDQTGKESWRDTLSWGQKAAIWIGDSVGDRNLETAAAVSKGAAVGAIGTIVVILAAPAVIGIAASSTTTLAGGSALYLGASASTAGTVATVAGAVTTTGLEGGMLAFSVMQTVTTGQEIITGRDAESGRELSDAERGYSAGMLVAGVIAFSFSARHASKGDSSLIEDASALIRIGAGAIKRATTKSPAARLSQLLDDAVVTSSNRSPMVQEHVSASSSSKTLSTSTSTPLDIPGSVRTRINVNYKGTGGNSPWHSIIKHSMSRGLPGNNRSVFTIGSDEALSIVTSQQVIRSSVTRLKSGNFERLVNIGRPIGISSLNKGGWFTTYMRVITDVKGNLQTFHPD